MSSTEIVHLTHHDLDALGCMLNLEIATPGIPKKTFHTNYVDIEEVISDVCEYISLNSPKLLVISDISFSRHKHLLLRLQNQNIKAIFIDHHRYTDSFFDDIHIKIHHNNNKSAAKITQEVFKTLGKNKNLDTLTNLIDVFDIWQDTREEFKSTLTINSYFWEKVNKKGLDNFYYDVLDNNYKLPHDFVQFYKENIREAQEKVQKARDKKLIMSDGFITTVFMDEFFNEVLYEEFKKGVQFVVIANSYGIVRYRFSNHSRLSDEIKIQIKKELLPDPNIGHLNAFGDKIPNHNFDKIMEKVKEVYYIINKYNN